MASTYKQIGFVDNDEPFIVYTIKLSGLLAADPVTDGDACWWSVIDIRKTDVRTRSAEIIYDHRDYESVRQVGAESLVDALHLALIEVL